MRGRAGYSQRELRGWMIHTYAFAIPNEDALSCIAGYGPIVEMGAGNGTLMLNILDYIRETDPAVYACTRFRIIEISSSLAALQGSRRARTSRWA